MNLELKECASDVPIGALSIVGAVIGDEASDQCNTSGDIISHVGKDEGQFVTLSTSPYFVNLDFFSGPLDLLLHLVHRQEVPIERVSMTLIADQYLDILSRFDKLDLNRLTEYLVVAATLVAIKSEAVLPKGCIEEFEDTEESRDPALLEELRERLRQYELTKQRAIALKQMPQLGVDTFIRPTKAICADIPESDEFISHDSYSLGQMFVGLLHRIGEGARTMRIHVESASVVSYMMRIIDDLQSIFSVRTGGSFFDVVRRIVRVKTMANKDVSKEDCKVSAAMMRPTLVGSFVAVLELCKRGVIKVSQDGDNEDINVVLREGFSAQSLAGALDASAFSALEQSVNSEWGDASGLKNDLHSDTPNADISDNVVRISDYVNAQHQINDEQGGEDGGGFRKEAQYG